MIVTYLATVFKLIEGMFYLIRLVEHKNAQHLAITRKRKSCSFLLGFNSNTAHYIYIQIL